MLAYLKETMFLFKDNQELVWKVAKCYESKVVQYLKPLKKVTKDNEMMLSNKIEEFIKVTLLLVVSTSFNC